MTQPYYERIERVRSHIRDNVSGDLSLDALADVAAMSRFHWHRVFHAMTGETVAEAVRRARMNRAAVLVVRTDRPVARIAAACGYANEQSFVRAFGRLFRTTPAAMRLDGRVPPPLLPPSLGDKIMFDVTTEDRAPAKAAALMHTGAYTEIGRTFGKLFPALGAAGIVPAGPVVGIYYDSPGTVPESEMRAHAGVIVDPGVILPEAVDLVDLPGGRMAVLTLKGPYDAIPAAWDYLYGAWLPASGEETRDVPPFERYLNDMTTTPPRDLLTEICVPLVPR